MTVSATPDPERKPANEDRRSLYSQVIRLSLPASAEFIIITSVVFADILFLSRLGTEVIAGVGIAVTVYRIFYELFYAVSVASTTVVAQAVGARNRDLACHGAGQSLLLAAALGVVSGGVGALISSHAMTLMGIGGTVHEAGTTYMRINLYASPFYALAFTGGGILKGAGDTVTPMLLTLLSSTFKILLSVCLIFGKLGMPALGVEGAALATLFAYGLNAVLVLGLLGAGFRGLKVGLRSILPNGELLRRIAVLTGPIAGERIFMRMGFIFYMRMVSALGTVALAANQIALRLESVSLTVGFGFTVAATTLVGQAIGRRDPEGAARRAVVTMRFSVLVMSVMTAVLILVRYWAVGMFKPDPDVMDLALACLIIGAFELPAFGVVFTSAGALRGAGDTFSPMTVAVVGTFLFRLPLVYLLGIHFGLGLEGIWYGTLLDWIGRAVLIYMIFRRGKWKHKAFITDDERAESRGSGRSGNDRQRRAAEDKKAAKEGGLK